MLLNRRAILHIDDDSAITQLVASHLEGAGYEVESLNSPLDALEAIERGQYRVVLLDVAMPYKSGMRLLPEIKQFDAGVQVVMLTGLVSVTTVFETMRLGAEACLFKPVTDPAPLLDAVDHAFRRADRWWHTLRDLTERRKQQETVLEEMEAGSLV